MAETITLTMSRDQAQAVMDATELLDYGDPLPKCEIKDGKSDD